MVKLLVSHGANRQLRDKVSVTEVMKFCVSGLASVLGRHGSDSLCRDERENKMAATYNVLAFKR